MAKFRTKRIRAHERLQAQCKMQREHAFPAVRTGHGHPHEALRRFRAKPLRSDGKTPRVQRNRDREERA